MTQPDINRNATVEIVSAFLRGRGWPHAQPSTSSRSQIAGVPAMAVEVTHGPTFDPVKSLLRHRARARLGMLSWTVSRRHDQGPESVDEWPVVLRLDDFTRLLADAGYGGGPDLGPDLRISVRPLPRDEA